MAFHLVAFGMSVLTSGVLQALTPVPDATVTENGTLLYVPAKYNQVVAVVGQVTGNVIGQAQLHAPSLRELFFSDISPLIIGQGNVGGAVVDLRFGTPMQLETNEGLEFFSDGGGDGTTARDAVGLVWFGDGPIQPAKGKHYKMRATSAIQAAPLTWTNGPIQFAQTLPVGTYQIVGLRATGGGLLAARLVFIGPSAITRPGVPGQGGITNPLINGFGTLDLGVLGSFNSITPPSMDVFGGSTNAQIYEFDLIKTA